MHIAVLGTGTVGRTLAGDLAAAGHQVVIGTRDPQATLARELPGSAGTFGDWVTATPGVDVTDMTSAVGSGDLIVNALNGLGSLDVVTAAGPERFAGKVVIDVTNPLDFSRGFPPTLFVKDTDSLAEQVQRAAPEARVVKCLNMMAAPLMLHPERLPEPTTVFLCGDDPSAKDAVTELLQAAGWRDIVDLGGLSAARGMEMWLALWVRAMGPLGGAMFNIKVVRAT